jgi:hypothetical protein
MTFSKRTARGKTLLSSFRRKPESRIMPAFAGIQLWTPFFNGVTEEMGSRAGVRSALDSYPKPGTSRGNLNEPRADLTPHPKGS